MAETVSLGPFPERVIRVGVYVAEHKAIVVEQRFEPGSDVVPAEEAAESGLKLRGWTGTPMLLIERGTLLHFGPGMRLIMCDEAGGHRVTGTYDELTSAGLTFPMPIPVSRLNVSVRQGIAAFIEFMAPIPATAQVQG